MRRAHLCVKRHDWLKSESQGCRKGPAVGMGMEMGNGNGGEGGEAERASAPSARSGCFCVGGLGMQVFHTVSKMQRLLLCR